MSRCIAGLGVVWDCTAAVWAQELGACCRDDGTCIQCTRAECLCVGDCNCNGSVDFNDISAFVHVLAGRDPCLGARCDMNGDGWVDFRDIDPFVTILAQAGGPCPGGKNGRWIRAGMDCQRCCWLTPPPGSVPEGEPFCTTGYVDHYNGGCWSNPPVFQPIQLDQTVFGHTGENSGQVPGCDSDYYTFTLAEPTAIRVELLSEVGTHFCLQRPGPTGGCQGVTVVQHYETWPCFEMWLTPSVLPPGEYWIFICGSISWECRAAYILTLRDLSAAVEDGSSSSSSRLPLWRATGETTPEWAPGSAD